MLGTREEQWNCKAGERVGDCQELEHSNEVVREALPLGVGVTTVCSVSPVCSFLIYLLLAHVNPARGWEACGLGRGGGGLFSGSRFCQQESPRV